MSWSDWVGITSASGHLAAKRMQELGGRCSASFLPKSCLPMFVCDMIAISVATLSSSETIGFDLYCPVDDRGTATLYRGANYPIDNNDFRQLRERGVAKLYIPRESVSAYQNYLRDAAAGADESISAAQKAAALNEVVLAVLQTNFANRRTDDTVASAMELGRFAADLVTRKDFAAGDLFRVLRHDYTTFTHSANVAFYAGILAAQWGICEAEIEQIVAGGILHDLGKLNISDKILTKPGRLDADEVEMIKRHPTDGFRQLAHRTDLSVGQLMMVYQHHERIDGRGYPVGCTGDEVHPWAKLCAVVDIYEAVTSQRPYRKPMTNEQAISLLMRESEQALEPEMVRCWVSIIRNASRTGA